MLTAAKTGMVVAGEKLLIRFETANTSFDKLYFGSKDDAFKSPYVQGTARSGGGWMFEFELPASYRGTPMPIALGKPDGGWYTTKDLVISIPADGDCDTGHGDLRCRNEDGRRRGFTSRASRSALHRRAASAIRSTAPSPAK